MKNSQSPLTVTVGIPTYETGESLLLTLNSIYKQTAFSHIKEILIVVDGKPPKKNILRRLHKSNVRVVVKDNRKGQSTRINDIFSLAKGDVVVLTNDDVILDKKAIELLINHFDSTSDDLLMANVTPLKSNNWLSQCLAMGVYVNKDIAEKWNMTNNYLVCNGRLLAFSRRLYRKIKIPEMVWNNDAYIYLYATYNNYSSHYCHDVIARYQLPTAWGDHLKQSTKFQGSLEDNRRYFLQDISQSYAIPVAYVLKSFIKGFIAHPVLLICYLCIALLTRIIFNVSTYIPTTIGYWETDISTKHIELKKS